MKIFGFRNTSTMIETRFELITYFKDRANFVNALGSSWLLWQFQCHPVPRQQSTSQCSWEEWFWSTQWVTSVKCMKCIRFVLTFRNWKLNHIKLFLGLFVCWLPLLGITILSRWAPKGWKFMAKNLARSIKVAVKISTAFVLVAGVTALLMGLLFDYAILTPLRVQQYQTPISKQFLHVQRLPCLSVCTGRLGVWSCSRQDMYSIYLAWAELVAKRCSRDNL